MNFELLSAVEGAVIKSGTLSLVEPFVQSHDPYEFAEANPSHAQGRSGACYAVVFFLYTYMYM